MRYAIFSDVHANRQAWEAVLADALRQGADTLVCLGDVVGYGPRPLEVLNAVREVTPNFVLGNHDAAACGRLDPSIFNERARMVIDWTRERLDEEAIAFLQQVPLQMDGAGIQFVHAEVLEPGEFGYVDGVGPADLNLRAMTEQLGFLGHTHLPLVYTMSRKGGPVTQLPPIDFQVERGKRYLVNVGSVGEPRTTDVRASYVIYDDVQKTVAFRKVVFDVDAYIADLEATGLDIRPYFVQVVDAGKVAGAPEPAAAPQMALAHLPKVAEVVAGHHGRVVLGSSLAGLGTGALGVGVAPPKSVSPVLLALVVALVLVVVGAVVVVAMKKDDEPLAQNPGGNAKEEGRETAVRGVPGAEKPAALRVVKAGPESMGPIKGLKMRLFSKSFQNLEELRTADENEAPNREVVLEDALLSLGHAAASDGETFGLVWEGLLSVPETGEYDFSLRAESGAALRIRSDVVVEVGGEGQPGEISKNRVLLRGGDGTPIRVEYFHRGGKKTLELTWAGPGFDGARSLVGTGPGTAAPAIAKVVAKPEPDPEPVQPEPKVQRVAPEKLSQDLLAYWSFDRRGTGKESRFQQNPDGSVTENLVAEKGQRIEALAPKRDIGKSWTNPTFAAREWTEGSNGVGYEDRPGGFRELLATRIAGEVGQRPHSVYVRIPFEVDDPADFAGLALYMKYDDGFVAYLNGNMMASRNAPNPLEWNAAATNENGDQAAVVPELFKVNRSMKYLQKGLNVLAIHGLNGGGGEPNDTNTGSTNSDLLILPRLVALRKDSQLPEEAEPAAPNEHDRVVIADSIKGTVTPAEGKYGESYQFENDGSIEIGSKDDYAIGDKSFSLSLWFTRDPKSTDTQARRLISAGAGGDQKAGWALWITQKGDGLTFAVGNGKSRYSTSAKHGSLANGEWRHVAVTVDRENEAVFVFIDGELVADQRVTLLKDGPIGSNSGLSIGKNSDDEQHHRGKLDDLAIWHRVLLPEEIEKIYESGKGLGEIFDGDGK